MAHELVELPSWGAFVRDEKVIFLQLLEFEQYNQR